MTCIITVPADVVPLLYSGLQLDICHYILPELDELYMKPGREDHPEWFTETYRRLDKTRELLLIIDWPREHPALEAAVEIDQFGETLLSGLQAELLTQRYLITAPRNGSKLRKEATRAVAIIERFLADLDAGRLALRRSIKRTITSRMVERAIVLQLTRNDHPEQWCRAELERTLHDVEALAVNDALERLSTLGIIDLDGEHATASESVRYLDGLRMVSV